MGIFDNLSLKKEFNNKVQQLTFIYQEAHKSLSPVNNIYWCYNLNINNEQVLTNQQLQMYLKKFLAYVSQIISLHDELNELYNSHVSLSNSCEIEYNSVNKLFTSMISDLSVMISNFHEMNRVYKSETNRLILENLDQGLRRLQKYIADTHQSKNIIAII